jgi:predicted ribonuclease YlaK
MNIRHFYDTNYLLDFSDKVFDNKFIISSKTLEEIESIKNSQNKSEEIRYKARNLSRLLNKYSDKYDVAIVYQSNYEFLNSIHIPINNDTLILSCVWQWNKDIEPIIFITQDNNMRLLGSKIFDLNVLCESEECNDDLYTGYKELTLSDEDFEYFYSNLNKNIYNCLTNEYLIIKNKDGEIKERRKWNGHEYQVLKYKPFKSKILNEVKPLDSIQMCVFDSIINNEITMLYGKAGSGKTIIPLAYIMQGLEAQKIRKCYIVHHYETLKKAKTLGFEAGSHETKLLNSGSLGNILSSKFSDYKYITSILGDKIEIIPTANIRGVEFGSDDVVFVTECQNIDSYTLKTIIQRCKSGCKQIYEGDMLEQSDVSIAMSGMKRMLDIFRGHDGFGCIKLSNNYRNPISELADRM